jgi:hypothetical protein
VGDQMVWWVMNDRAGDAPIGLEVQATAYAYHTAGPLDNVTLYRYQLLHKGDQPIFDAYFGSGWTPT